MDIKARFDELYGPRIEASQIVVRTRREAQEIHKKLRLGAKFERLAEDHSEDKRSAVRGGKMSRALTPADGLLWEATQSLKKGEISQIVPTRHGYHILRVDRATSKSSTRLEDVQDKLVADIRDSKGIAYMDTWYAKLLERSDVRKMLQVSPALPPTAGTAPAK